MRRSTIERRQCPDLRSSPISTTFPARLALFARITTRSILPRAARMVLRAVQVHCFAMVAAMPLAVTVTVTAATRLDIFHFLPHVNVFSTQTRIHNLAQPLIPLAEPVGIALAVLCAGLHPEELLVARAGELEHKDAAIGGAPHVVGAGLADQWSERCIAGDSDEVDFGARGGGGARSPAEMEEVVFRVEVEISGAGDGSDSLAKFFTAAGFEGDEGIGRHVDGLVVLLLRRSVFVRRRGRWGEVPSACQDQTKAWRQSGAPSKATTSADFTSPSLPLSRRPRRFARLVTPGRSKKNLSKCPLFAPLQDSSRHQAPRISEQPRASTSTNGRTSPRPQDSKAATTHRKIAMTRRAAGCSV